MEGHWGFPVAGTSDDSYTKALFDRYRSESVEWMVTNSEEVIEAVKTSTSNVLTSPYTPYSWIERACALVKLGYPDLAAFDAFRAVVLFARQEIVVPGSSGKGGRSRPICTGTTRILKEQSEDAHLVLAVALFFANSFHECTETLEFCNGEKAERLSRFARQGLQQERQFHLRKGLSPEEAEAELRAGTIRWTVYPWTRKDFLHRTDETMAPLKEGVVRESEGSCAIKRSRTIRNPGTEGRSTGPNEVLGMFATQNIAEGESLFQSSTAFVACSQEYRCSACGDDSKTDGVQLSCCSLIFCSKKCMVSSLGLCHNVRECIGPPILAKIQNPSIRKVFKIHRNRPTSSASDEAPAKDKVQTNLLQKIIGSAYQHAQTKDQHPLTYPLIRNLTIARGANEAVEFSLRKDIIIPMSTLETLGIDIFADSQFDAWVLQTIQARLRANSWEHKENGIEFLGLSPLFSLFNHSCRPNVKWLFGKDATTIELKTLRPVRAGEELYIYLQSEDLVLGRAERKKLLLHWFTECQCPKCKGAERASSGDGRVRQPQKKRPRIAMPATEKELIQLPSPAPDSEPEEDSIRALLATVKVDDATDLDFDNAEVSDESGYESSSPKLVKRRRRK
ncbi:hypothetical protein E2P81_ATG06156 [Venturia nashicola]|uniref:SET domain-containing protein n=1 Tax=Venturia nashicola TaxID=86259 RepID=A0A4Z1P247_9PEZI|nr:hypothetical protein E6O75_ATG06296 [Venturia nashicola]TLD27810.1 hypothetical protein E2P81_ATG06156 [Venturia nashicola]